MRDAVAVLVMVDRPLGTVGVGTFPTDGYIPALGEGDGDGGHSVAVVFIRVIFVNVVIDCIAGLYQCFTLFAFIK